MTWALAHTCIIQSGSLEGNTHMVTIDPWDIEAGNECEVCGEPLIPLAKAIAEIYERILEGE